MILDERTAAFIHSFDPELPEYLYNLEQSAKREDVPIIRKDMQMLLRFLMKERKPQMILEVGTAVGFSALLMSEYAPADCKITTIEKYEKRIPVALENFSKFGKQNRINLIAEDAADVLKRLEPPYDFIFMDAAKGQYFHFLEDVIRLLPIGGMLVSDNVLQDGEIIESRFAVTRRNRTIHARMREYLYVLTHNACLETVILPVGDGITISIKK